MQAQDFAAKWGPGGPARALRERVGAQAHAALDAAVAAAYGWTAGTCDLPDDEILRRLPALNRERARK